MPQHLRALIVVLVLAGIVFAFAKRPARDLDAGKEFSRRRSLWFALTLLAFLAHDFWIYVVLSAIIVILAAQREHNPPALFFFLLFLIPNLPEQIPAFGILNYLIALDHVRLMSVCILLPAFLVLQRRNDTPPFGTTSPDKLLVGYLLLHFALGFRETTVTNALREDLYLFTDVFLPYYVFSRSVKDIGGFRHVLFAFVLAAMLQAVFGVFEFVFNWNLYTAQIRALGLEWELNPYLYRAGGLRARAATGHPIALGYVLVIALGLFLFLKDSVRSKIVRYLGGSLLSAGIVVPLSRGPWVGAVVLLLTFISTGRFAARRLAIIGLAGIAAIPILSALPGADRVIDVLPFVGTVERNNIDYRTQLMENSMIVLKRHPWFGSANYYEAPEMEEMRQGQGIIDVVNTYLGVALETGLAGLGLFAGFFAFVLRGIYKAKRSLPSKDDETHRLGSALLATQVSILVIIFTVSSISIIPVTYWSIAGLGVAYAQMIRQRLTSSEYSTGLKPVASNYG